MASNTSSEDLNGVLERCLRAIEQGRATPDQCLAACPAHASELEPLLRAALALRAAPRPSMPAERMRSLEQVVVARAVELAARRPKKQSRSRVGRLRGARRWAIALSAVLALILLSGVGTVAAASEALPGEPLYRVKRATEDVRLSVTPEANKPDLLVHLAEERLEEAEVLAEAGEVTPEVTEDLLGASQDALEALEGTSGAHHDELAKKLVTLSERQQAVLSRVIEKAPPEAQQGLQRALEASQHGHERAIQALSGEKQTGPPEHAGPPDGEGPPGQQDKEPGPPDTPPGQDKDDKDKEPKDTDESQDKDDKGKGHNLEDADGSQDEPAGQGGGPKCDSPPCDQNKNKDKDKGKDK